MAHYLGIEIGGTKLQLGLGNGAGPHFDGFWRDAIDARAGGARIRQQIVAGIQELLASHQLTAKQVAGIGIGFGGPVDAHHGRIMTSHQVGGWNDFPLRSWVTEQVGIPVVLQNDADTAALAEATFGAGAGFDPVMYCTVGSGIGGGLICGGKIFRGCGSGAMEIGHLRPWQNLRYPTQHEATVEAVASGFGIEQRARWAIETQLWQKKDVTTFEPLLARADHQIEKVSGKGVAELASQGDRFCCDLLADAMEVLGWALAQAIALVNPARIVVGGGVSLMGQALFFEPVRAACQKYIFHPFAGNAAIVPAALEEAVVVHGAIALAKDAFGTARST